MTQSPKVRPEDIRASWRFFAGIGRASSATKKYDTETLPLFSLPLILDAEGLLARDMRRYRREEIAA